MMEASLAKVAEMQPQPAQTSTPRRTRKPRQQTEEVVRYFLAKEGSSIEKPELGAEVASEGEALIKAFQSKNGMIYALLAYKAEAEIQGGSPTLVKRALRNESAQAGRK
jgi:hypothetical protein